MSTRKLFDDRARFVAFATFLAAVFFMGGASRPDVASLVILRPLAIGFLIYALLAAREGDLRKVRWPIGLLLGLMALMLLQLVPLPPSIWRGLPGREVVAQLGDAMGLGEIWRPLTLSPAGTWNAFWSLFIPMAVLALYAIQDQLSRRRIWLVVLGLAAAGCLLGVLQLLGSARGPAYLYSVTNPGNAVGFFANRNHHGVFLATMIIVAAWLFASVKGRDRLRLVKGTIAIAAIVVFVPMIFLAGSRAGLVCAALALPAALYFASQSKLLPDRLILTRKLSVSRNAALLGLGIAFLVLVVIVILSSRAIALDRLIGTDDVDSLRLSLLPVLLEMLSELYVWGAGFGSFELIYRSYEPLELLGPQYLNQAHNDWIELIIEGGLPAALLLLALVVFLLKGLAHLRGIRKGERKLRVQMAFLIVGILGLASAVDYVLRTPIAMALFALCCATIAASTRGGREEPGETGGFEAL